MAEITLVRHGQASFGADNYDCLSDLGEQQAVWLGDYYRQLGVQFDRLVLGDMRRHEQTARGLMRGLHGDLPMDIHPGLNEYEFGGLLTPYRNLFPERWHDTGHARRDYFHNLNAAMLNWSEGVIDNDGTDSWVSFCARVRDGFAFACAGSARRTLVVSSGGPIAVLIGEVLALSPARICDLSLQIKNTSTSRILYNRVNFTLDSFNDMSHLNHPQRQDKITFS